MVDVRSCVPRYPAQTQLSLDYACRCADATIGGVSARYRMAMKIAMSFAFPVPSKSDACIAHAYMIYRHDVNGLAGRHSYRQQSPFDLRRQIA